MTDFSMNSQPNQYPGLEILRQVNIYLEKVAELDPVRRPEHLARLDHLIGFNTTSDGVSKAQSLSKTYLLTEAKAVGLEINPELRAKIENSNGDDVLFAI